jgi:hypothetical protein
MFVRPLAWPRFSGGFGGRNGFSKEFAERRGPRDFRPEAASRGKKFAFPIGGEGHASLDIFPCQFREVMENLIYTHPG